MQLPGVGNCGRVLPVSPMTPPPHCSSLQPVLLLLQEIVDETDRYVDREQMQRVNAGKLVRNLPPRLRK